MEGKKIYTAISAVMKDCGAVAKTSTNPQQRYKYRGIDAVMNALNPAMIKNGIFVVPNVLEQKREERTTAKGGLLIYSVVTVNYKFYADDGSFVESTVVGEAMDSGDKATNKAMSAAFKYALFQTFCIPTEEMHDSEEDSPEPIPFPRNVGEPMISEKQTAYIGGLSRRDNAIANYVEMYIQNVGKNKLHELLMREATTLIGDLKADKWKAKEV